MARAIIRFSLDGDNGRNMTLLRKQLQADGFVKTGTAVYEGDFYAVSDALHAVRDIVDAMASLVGGVTLDHLWIYVDEPDPH